VGTEPLIAFRHWRLRGVTIYRRDPGVGSRYWHYRGHRPYLLSARWCRLFGHSWHYWEPGVVIDGGEGPARFTSAFRTCERHGCKARG
jgi:hypothetical protein